MSIKAAQFTFSGKVQGVGFRFTCRKFADALGLFGWVKNLPDGKVEMFVEGDGLQLEHLLAQLKDQFEISDSSYTEIEKTGEFTGFSIVY